MLREGAEPEPLPVSGEDETAMTATIFVSIVSYRDPECQHTLMDLFRTATQPGRVSVGLVWQYCEDEDAHCFQVSLPPLWAKQVRITASADRIASNIVCQRETVMPIPVCRSPIAVLDVDRSGP